MHISTEDIKCNFLHIKESKASSPLGQHVCHNIVAAKMHDARLQQLYWIIASTALILNAPLP